MKKKLQNTAACSKVREMVAKHFGEDPVNLYGGKASAMARNLTMYILKEGLGETISNTAEAVSVKAPLTVHNGCKAIAELLKTDTALAQIIEDIKIAVLATAVEESGLSPQEPSQKTIPPSTGETKDRNEHPKQLGLGDKGTFAISVKKVQKAVADVFLGSALLTSTDPAAEVLLARDVIAFVLWTDFDHEVAEITSLLALDLKDFYTGIGKISVLNKSGNEIRKKLREVRAIYGAV